MANRSTGTADVFSTYVVTLSIPAAVVAAVLYIPFILWHSLKIMRITAASKRIAIPIILFCTLRTISFIVRAILASARTFSLALIFQVMFLGTTPALLLGFAEAIIIWVEKADDVTVAFLGRDALDWSRTFRTVLFWYYTLTVFFICCASLYGTTCAYFTIDPALDLRYKSACWDQQYVMFYIAAWIGLTVFISVAYYRLKYHTRTQLQRLQREEELELTRRTATATAVAVDPSSKSVAIEGSHYGWLRLRTESPISERHAAMTTMARKVVFESASRALVRAPFALFIPSAMLMLARTAYAPTVVSTVELGGQQWAERVWYPVIVGFEMIILFLISIPLSLSYLEIESVRLVRDRNRAASGNQLG